MRRYGSCGDEGGTSDAAELLDGRLLPECRLLVTSCGAYPLHRVQRRVQLSGLDWPHVERLVAAYFTSNKKPESANRFLEIVGSSHQVRNLYIRKRERICIYTRVFLH